MSQPSRCRRYKSGMTDVVDSVLNVHTANLLLQWSSAKNQSVAEGGVAKHFIVEAESKLFCVCLAHSGYAPYFRLHPQLVYNTL
jgi:hypothetical protein